MLERLYEQKAHHQGYKRIAGVDEAGRGPLAGPVVAAAVVLPSALSISGIADSKVLSSKEREEIFNQVIDHPDIDYGIGIVSAEQIDALNILQATFLAMSLAVKNLSFQPDFLLVDGNLSPRLGISDQPIVKGDTFELSIALASVLAKVKRDHVMMELDARYPLYGFAKHKGYGTQKHRLAIQTHGISPVHRKSFAPCKEATSTKSQIL